jgi:drug/metabolite transporter (DMT)-like permease
MTGVAILLLSVSAVLHASWNFISKSNSPSAAFLLVANTVGCVILVPVAVVFGVEYAAFPSSVWMLIIITGLFQALYYASLAGAYRSGDMSLAYPLARSSPVIVVTVVTFILGEGDTISLQCVVGIVLVVAGCSFVPLKTFSGFHLRNYLCRTCGFALLAAVGTAGYSIVDAEALRWLRESLSDESSIVVVTILYALAEAISSSLWLLLFVSVRKEEREQLTQVMKSGKRMALLAGVGIYLTYTLVLISMSWAKNVSYVVGFRQLSIPIGVMMGVFLLREPLYRPKAFGVVILLIGLVLIAV